MHISIHKLENGLPVILINTKAFPSVTTMVLVGAGSRYENTKNNGIAHFFEHMAFKGSKTYPDAFTISSTIDRLGGVFNAFTSKDHTGYWVKAPNSHFGKVIDVLSDMILHPKLLQEEIDREKNVIVEEINMYEDMPSRKVSDIFDDLLFNGHPLSYDIAGTTKTVTNFTRKTFTDYIDTYYHPHNAVIVVAGGLTQKVNIDSPEVTEDWYLQQIQNKFNAWKPKKKHTFEKFINNQTKPAISVKYKKTEQAHFSLGFKAFSFKDDRRHILSVLSAILGGGMSSRLFMEVRERRGLCYYISTGRDLYEDTGYIVTQAGVTNNKEKLQESINVVLKEHTKIANGEVTDEEVEKAKEMLKGRFLLSIEDSHDVASLIGTKYLLDNRIVYPEDTLEHIEQVTKADIINLAKELFIPATLNIAVIGPFKEEDIKI
ncbi:MAG TPA: pitrilysin family protein [Candidatus Woesebacteria bacterium]|mgnify:CR=1 FL=1|nr:pitrilysin family protein [Candidatus Woesebacteria bacterium]